MAFNFTYQFTIQAVKLYDVLNITKDEVRLIFSDSIALIGVDNVNNYSFLPSTVNVLKVLMPRNDTGSITYIDLNVLGLEPETNYTVTVRNLYNTKGYKIGTQVGTFRTEVTKTSRIIDGLPSMYNTEVDSTLRHVLLAIGISDDQIGGNRVKRLQS
jgi:hypothetical protein